MTTDEIISRCYEHGQPDYVLAADRLKELQAALAAAPPQADAERMRRAVLACIDMIQNCADAPKNPDSLPEMVKVHLQQALSRADEGKESEGGK